MNKQTTRTAHHIGPSPRAETAYPAMSDIQLIESCQHSDQVAFKYLMMGCERKVQGALLRLAPELREFATLKRTA